MKKKWWRSVRISFFIRDFMIHRLFLKSKALCNLYLNFSLHPRVEFSKAVLGTIALIGKEILVKFKSPLIIFFPINFIISLPIDLIFDTCLASPQIFPPFECPNSCLGYYSSGKNLNLLIYTSSQRLYQQVLKA